MKLLAIALVAAAVCVATTAAYDSTIYGIDVSVAVSKSQFDCLKSNNLTFSIIRGWHSYGKPDTNVVATASAARAAGMDPVDVYMFPCQSCGDAKGQAESLVNYLDSNGVKYSTIWLDVEGPGTYWSSDQASNADFISDLIDGVKDKHKSVGVYTSKSQWIPIVGSWTGASHLDLWYADYDGVPTFGDFTAFGGWSKPYMKQFTDQGAKCGVSYDINWRPPH